MLQVKHFLHILHTLRTSTLLRGAGGKSEWMEGWVGGWVSGRTDGRMALSILQKILNEKSLSTNAVP